MVYSFLIGRNSSVKVVISLYMSILAADGLGNVFNQYLIPAAPSLQGDTGVQALVLFKIAVFVLVILLLVVKGRFRVDMLPESSVLTRLLSNATFGFLSAGLIICTLLMYLSGASFIGPETSFIVEGSLYRESELVQVMIDNYSVWFALPALAVVAASFFEARSE
jgi:hypothetical protein